MGTNHNQGFRFFREQRLLPALSVRRPREADPVRSQDVEAVEQENELVIFLSDVDP
jgi:hypothetical protein